MKTFLLPDKCETCGAESVYRSVSTRYCSGGLESTEYKCGARYEMYLTHKRRDIKQPCPQSPAEIHRHARWTTINAAVAQALNAVQATYAECELFPKLMERDKYQRDGVWALLDAKRTED